MRARWVTAAALSLALLPAQTLKDLRTPVPLPSNATLVVGFLGGFEHWNDPQRGIRKLVLSLRDQPGVFAESVGNHHRRVALRFILKALDRNRDGRLDPEECRQARVILVGQSWGGAAAIATARDLDRLGVPVLLTAQIDSVGTHDGVIPPNVAAAVNFYQHDPLTIRGRSEIRAADASQTRIIGNFPSSYLMRSIDKSQAAWARRTLGGSHAKMELDPEIWLRVRRYIDDAIIKR